MINYRAYIAEYIGTFILVFFGTGAIVINQESGGIVTHPGVAITFGLTVLAMIQTIGDISGSHINPAVTLAFAVAKRFPWAMVAPYVLSQLLGAITGSVLLHLLFPSNVMLGATVPSGDVSQSFILEGILTFVLMYVVLNVSSGSKEKGITAGLTVASVVGLEAMFAGPICGASMNPFRSLAPALVNGHLEFVWLYCVAPVSGALVAVVVNKLTRKEINGNNRGI